MYFLENKIVQPPNENEIQQAVQSAQEPLPIGPHPGLQPLNVPPSVQNPPKVFAPPAQNPPQNADEFQSLQIPFDETETTILRSPNRRLTFSKASTPAPEGYNFSVIFGSHLTFL